MNIKFPISNFKFPIALIVLTAYYLLLTVLTGTLFTTPTFAQVPPPTPPAAGIRQVQDMTQRLIGVSVGLAFFFMTAYLVWSGIKFITSGGESKAIADAWRVFTWAIMGILFLILGWLTLVLIRNFTGADVTKFCFGFPGAPTACFP